MKINNKTLFDVLDFKIGKAVKLKSLKEGDTEILKSGKKTYKKDIKTNLEEKEYIVINNMSCDLTFISKDNYKNYYIGNGCFMMSLKKEYEGIILLKYLYYIINLQLIDVIKNLRHGSLQQFINIGDLKKLFSQVKLN